MLFGRDMNESRIIRSKYEKSTPRDWAKRITSKLSSAVEMSRATNGFEVQPVGTR